MSLSFIISSITMKIWPLIFVELYCCHAYFKKYQVNWKFVCMFEMSNRFEWINIQLTCALSVSYWWKIYIYIYIYILINQLTKIMKIDQWTVNKHLTVDWRERRVLFFSFNKELQVNGLIKLICFFLMITTIVYVSVFVKRDRDIRFFFLWGHLGRILYYDGSRSFSSNDLLPFEEYCLNQSYWWDIFILRRNQCWICHCYLVLKLKLFGFVNLYD